LFISDKYSLKPEQEKEYSKMIEDSKEYDYRITDEYNYKVLQDETLIPPRTSIEKSYKVGDIITMSKAYFNHWVKGLNKSLEHNQVTVTQKCTKTTIYEPPKYKYDPMKENIILYLIDNNIIIGYVESSINHNCISIEMVKLKNSFIGKGLCKLLISQFINFTKYLGKNYYLLNAAGLSSYMCYFKAFSTEYDVYTFQVADDKNFKGIVDQTFMKKTEEPVVCDNDYWMMMFFVKKNVLASASAHEGGNNKKLYHKLINYLNFSL